MDKPASSPEHRQNDDRRQPADHTAAETCNECGGVHVRHAPLLCAGRVGKWLPVARLFVGPRVRPRPVECRLAAAINPVHPFGRRIGAVHENRCPPRRARYRVPLAHHSDHPQRQPEADHGGGQEGYGKEGVGHQADTPKTFRVAASPNASTAAALYVSAAASGHSNVPSV